MVGPSLPPGGSPYPELPFNRDVRSASLTQPSSSAPSAAQSFAFRRRGTQTSRLEAFSDAVIALTLTLLLVSTQVPGTFPELVDKLSGFLPLCPVFCHLHHHLVAALFLLSPLWADGHRHDRYQFRTPLGGALFRLPAEVSVRRGGHGSHV